MQTRWSQSLGELEATHQEVWGTGEYRSTKEPTVFFGLYDLRDYLALWRHKGKAWVLWAGSDILNLKNGFVFNDGKLKLLSRLFRGNGWVFPILKKAEHWVENEKEKEVLESLGIRVSGVCPSFLGNTGFEVSWKPAKPMNVYVSATGGRVEEYGFPIVERIAKDVPFAVFHLYGSDWNTKEENVIVHGRVPKEQMNKEISSMQVGLRLNNFDGFSEVLAKAVLRGQYAIGKVKHPHIPSFESDLDLILELDKIYHKEEPNLEARRWYLENLNSYPWNLKKNWYL